MEEIKLAKPWISPSEKVKKNPNKTPTPMFHQHGLLFSETAINFAVPGKALGRLQVCLVASGALNGTWTWLSSTGQINPHGGGWVVVVHLQGCKGFGSAPASLLTGARGWRWGSRVLSGGGRTAWVLLGMGPRPGSAVRCAQQD